MTTTHTESIRDRTVAVTNQVVKLLTDMGRETILHTVVTGGQSLNDTLNGFDQLANAFRPNGQFVVWLNPYWGEVQADGKHFEQFNAYVKHKATVAAIVKIPTWKEETFGRDITDMLKARQTFDEAIADPAMTIMTRQRLKIAKEQLFAQMTAARVI